MSKSRARTDADLAEGKGGKSAVLVTHATEGMSVKKEIPTLEHITLVFELTSFAADVLGKLIKPRKRKNAVKNILHGLTGISK